MPRLNLPRDKDVAKSIVETEAAQINKKLEMGLLGKLLGSSGEKPGNVAGFIALLSFLSILALLLWGRDQPNFILREQILLILPLLTSSLGYMFGERTSQRTGS